MAAPIAHVFLAVGFLSVVAGRFNEKEFIRGTLFPDIRYLKVVQRGQTHFKNISLNDVKKEQNAFKAGVLFHSFVDEEREKFMVAHKVYERLPNFKFTTQALKLAEDQALMNLVDIKKYSDYFSGALLLEEQGYGIADEHVHAWHNFLREYFLGNMTYRDFTLKYFDLNDPESWSIKRNIFSWWYGNKINDTVEAILSDDILPKLIIDFYTLQLKKML